jgi:hypothetical protein
VLHGVSHLLGRQLSVLTSKLPYETGESYDAILYARHQSSSTVHITPLC